jgi:hypothetical protein
MGLLYLLPHSVQNSPLKFMSYFHISSALRKPIATQMAISIFY